MAGKDKRREQQQHPNQGPGSGSGSKKDDAAAASSSAPALAAMVTPFDHSSRSAAAPDVASSSSSSSSSTRNSSSHRSSLTDMSAAAASAVGGRNNNKNSGSDDLSCKMQPLSLSSPSKSVSSARSGIVGRMRQSSTSSDGTWFCVVCCQKVPSTSRKQLFAIGPCDHPVCAVCSTKMRVLCDQDECPICRQEITKVTVVCVDGTLFTLASNLYFTGSTADLRSLFTPLT